MGTWDFGPFENDSAADWLYELEASPDSSILASTLKLITEIGDDYLEAPDCESAIAAAEIVAALNGKPRENLPDIASEWLKKHQSGNPASLLPTATAAIKRIQTNSELQELWAESDESDKWNASLDDLLSRLA